MKQKNKVKKKSSNMHGIETTQLWLFSHAKCKSIFHSHLLHWHWLHG
jgi:hypothetical protein